jgi:hypothetical protein
MRHFLTLFVISNTRDDFSNPPPPSLYSTIDCLLCSLFIIKERQKFSQVMPLSITSIIVLSYTRSVLVKSKPIYFMNKIVARSINIAETDASLNRNLLRSCSFLRPLARTLMISKTDRSCGSSMHSNGIWPPETGSS